MKFPKFPKKYQRKITSFKIVLNGCMNRSGENRETTGIFKYNVSMGLRLGLRSGLGWSWDWLGLGSGLGLRLSLDLIGV